MKTRIYDSNQSGQTAFELYEVYDNGGERFLDIFVYDTTKENQAIWGKDEAWNRAKEKAKYYENPTWKNLVYETGFDDCCINYEADTTTSQNPQ